MSPEPARIPVAGPTWDEEVELVEAAPELEAGSRRAGALAAVAGTLLVLFGLAALLTIFATRNDIHRNGPLSGSAATEASLTLPEGEDWATFAIPLRATGATEAVELIDVVPVTAGGVHAMEMATVVNSRQTIGASIGWPPVGVGSPAPVDETTLHVESTGVTYLLVGINPAGSGRIEDFTVRYRYRGLIYEDILPATLAVS